MELFYGRSKLNLKLPAGAKIRILQPQVVKPLEDPEKALQEMLQHPIASVPLRNKVYAGDTVSLLVNDSTRVARSDFFLPYLINELLEAGIKEKDIFIVFANGSHRPLSESEMVSLVGENVASRIRLYNHDSKDETNLVLKGKTSFGTPVYVNKMVAEADRRILTGSVVHHFFAGFGGGRKALIPGVAGWETIRINHSRLLDEEARTGALKGNPVHEDLLEAAQMVGCDFLLNTVLNENKELLGIFGGDMIEAHLAACDLVEKVNGVELEEHADVVIASCGGFPKDINMYQSHKTLDNAMQALKPGGKMILLAECHEGIGSAAFEEWANKYSDFEEMEEALRREFVLGGHKAYTVSKLLRKGKVFLFSDVDPQLAIRIGFIPVTSLEEAVELVYGEDTIADTVIIPQGSLVVPRVSDK
ncbi:MAG: nickel-dependent lactate racemase [Bacillota bacterium]|nr:nickel-dependent lactate racemase [Bacillota bacterium]